jgi:outer membrane immunogenic protein
VEEASKFASIASAIFALFHLTHENELQLNRRGNDMKRFYAPVLGLTLSSALALAAHAADIYPGGGAKNVPDYAPVQTWSGFYFGGNAGGLFINRDNNDHWYGGEEPAVPQYYSYGAWRDDGYFWRRRNNDDSFITGGIQAGFNWQGAGSPFVLGFEADVDFAHHVNYLASARGKLGYAWRSAMLYATGGGAWGEFRNNDGFGYTSYGFTGDSFYVYDRNRDVSLAGWVAGAGLDYKPGTSLPLIGGLLGPNVSIGVLGLYYSFDNNDRWWDVADGSRDWWRYGGRNNLEFWTVTARVNWTVGPYTSSAAPLK